jgi:phosphate:Na+ symporter
VITLLNLLAALALLVWGTHIVRTDVLSVYGVQLRRVLNTSIARRGNAFIAGLGVTGLVQSSNATAVIVCGFVSQGLIGLAPALAIMLGADVGTAWMAGVLSFDLSWVSPLLIFCGVSVYLSRRETLAGHLGRAAIGLGLILMALELIGQTTRPLTEAAGLKVLFSSLTGDVLLDAFIGALLAIATYSSLAAVLLAATLAGSGVISIEVGLSLAVGANLGSGVLALLGASRHNAAGRRVALGSMLFRMAGAVAVLPFIGDLPRLVAGVTADPRAGVVVFHVVYNSLRCALLLAFVTPMARLCERLVPAAEPDDDSAVRPRHLDPAALATPSLALAGAKREVLRMGEIVEQMLIGLLPVIRDNDRARAQQVRRLDDQVDTLYTAVKLYLARLPGDSLDTAQRQRWNETIELTIKLEQAGDIIDRIVSEVELKKIGPGREFSSAGLAEVCEMHARLMSSLVLGLSVFLNHDVESAQRLLAEKDAFRDLERAYARSHLTRLAGETPQSIETSALHLDLISDMKRLHSLFCSAAYPVLDAAGMLPRRRLGVDEAT